MTKILEKQKKSLLEEYDYEQKIRILTLNKRIAWFVSNKKQMSQNEKWEAVDDMCDDYATNRKQLVNMINFEIRKKGLSVRK